MWPFKTKQVDQATNSLDLFNLLFDPNTNAVSPGNANRLGDVYACIKVLAESVGMLPIDINLNNGGDRTPVDSGAQRVIAIQPNQFQTAQEYWEMVIHHLCVAGNHYSIKNVVRGELRELLPLDPFGVKVDVKSYSEVVYEVNELDSSGNKSQKTYSSDQIFHVPLMSMDGFVGLSPITQAQSTFESSKLMETFWAKLFKNLVRPSGILSTDGSLTQPQLDMVKSQWDQYKGAENVGATPVLQGGLKWIQTQLSSVDAQFIEGKKLTRAQICGIFRVPPHMVGDLEHATFSNIESQGIQFVQYSLAPYLTRIENRVAMSLLKQPARGTLSMKFNTNALMRGDSKARSEFYTKMWNVGAYNSNEIRALEDQPPRADGQGDVYMSPANMMPAGAADEPDTIEEEEEAAEVEIPTPSGKRVLAEYDTDGRFTGATVANIR
jgi:HK97 family phage portal protein